MPCKLNFITCKLGLGFVKIGCINKVLADIKGLVHPKIKFAPNGGRKWKKKNLQSCSEDEQAGVEQHEGE